MPNALNLYQRAAVIPGRSMTRSKSPDRVRRAWAVDGQGAVLRDSDGKTYIDMVCGLGAISLGYRQHQRLSVGGVYSLPHVSEVYAAEAVLEHVAPWASSVRFLKTGSEATHAAYRIAKRATGRRHVLMGNWAYHGWHAWCDDPSSGSVFRYPLGTDFDGWRTNEIAAVFVEPHRFEPTPLAWLQSVRAFCDRIGALLVFDEMIYGGRWALGGSIALHGVVPDLACFGKAFGNGEAVAFVVGRDALAEHGEMVSGTFSGDVTGLSAVCDVLHTYTTEPVIETIWARGTQLGDGLRQVLPASLVTIDGAAPLQRLRFTYPAHQTGFKDAMHVRSVLSYPEWLMTCYAHTKQQMDQVIAAAEASACVLERSPDDLSLSTSDVRRAV